MKTRRSRRGPEPVSDALWFAIEPLLPRTPRASGRVFRRRAGAGRKPVSARKAFDAIVYVLRTGIPWKTLPRRYGSASAVHRRYVAWREGGLFLELWRAGLAEHREMAGIPWHWKEHRNHFSHSDRRDSPRLWEPYFAKRKFRVS